MKLFLQTLLATEKHGAATSEKSARLIDSFSADLVISVTNGSVLTTKHYLLAVGLHSITGMKQIIQILHKMGNCMSYTKTCEVETAMAESTLAKRSNILPLLPIGHETVLTYFWADNFDYKVETQQAGKMVNTTHLMAFQETIEDTNVFLNTNDDYQVPRNIRRRVENKQGDVPNPIINKSQEAPKFEPPISPKHNSLFFLWLCFRKWNSHDQAAAL